MSATIYIYVHLFAVILTVATTYKFFILSCDGMFLAWNSGYIHVYVCGIITGCMIKCQDMMTTSTFSEYGVAHRSLYLCISASGWNDNKHALSLTHTPTSNSWINALLKWTICNFSIISKCFSCGSICYIPCFFLSFEHCPIFFLSVAIHSKKYVIFTWTVAHFWFVLCHWRTFISDCSEIKGLNIF